jgi:RNA polymerase sigma-70 factor (ECF subfamily)
VKSYFYQSVYNRILNHFNREKVQEKYIKNYLENNVLREINYYSNNNYPLANLLQKELEEKIVEIIDSLPPQCRKAFTFSRFENLKYDEISKKMDISVNSVKTHMKNALQKLRNALQEYLP